VKARAFISEGELLERSRSDLVGTRVADRSYGVIKQCHDFIELIIDVIEQSMLCHDISVADLELLRTMQAVI